MGEIGFAPDARHLAYTAFNKVGGDSSIRILDLATNKQRTVEIHRRPRLYFPRNLGYLANGRLVFTNGSGRFAATYTMRPDGTHVRMLFTREEVAAAGAGNRFVVDDKKGLWVVNANGKNIRHLAGPLHGGFAALSPKGRLVVFDRRNDRNQRDLYLAPAGRKGCVEVTDP